MDPGSSTDSRKTSRPCPWTRRARSSGRFRAALATAVATWARTVVPAPSTPSISSSATIGRPDPELLRRECEGRGRVLRAACQVLGCGVGSPAEPRARVFGASHPAPSTQHVATQRRAGGASINRHYRKDVADGEETSSSARSRTCAHPRSGAFRRRGGARRPAGAADRRGVLEAGRGLFRAWRHLPIRQPPLQRDGVSNHRPRPGGLFETGRRVPRRRARAEFQLHRGAEPRWCSSSTSGAATCTRTDVQGPVRARGRPRRVRVDAVLAQAPGGARRDLVRAGHLHGRCRPRRPATSSTRSTSRS